jgi:nucleolysin TIA-1/TIAR
MNGITEELMQKTFAQFGTIMDIRVFKDKGYAFIRFATKECATHAIESVHNTEINGQVVKCFWGKETGDPNHGQNAAGQTPAATQYQYPYGQQMGYWYPQGYQAQAATAAQMQGQYALQAGMQYPYGQFGYQQAYGSMAGRMGMQLPTAWQGVQAQPPGTAQQMAAAAAQGAAMQQQPGMMAYTMQQFQTQ